MEISNLSDSEFKTLVMRTLKELSEDFSSIKKTQAEPKDALIEMKNNVQGNNSRVHEAENLINDLEHKEAKKQPISTTRRKKNPKKPEDSVSSLWDNFKRSYIYRGARRRRERARNWKSI